MSKKNANIQGAVKEGSAPVSFEMQLKMLLQEAAMAYHHPPENAVSSSDKGTQKSHRSLKVCRRALGREGYASYHMGTV
jgi:hypothetical protein